MYLLHKKLEFWVCLDLFLQKTVKFTDDRIAKNIVVKPLNSSFYLTVRIEVSCFREQVIILFIVLAFQEWCDLHYFPIRTGFLNKFWYATDFFIFFNSNLN